MSSGFRHAPPDLLSVLTMPAKGQGPWVREPGAFRILMDPGIGWPLGPFVVVFTPFEANPDTVEPVGWTTFGDAEGGDVVNSEAWLALDPRDQDSDPGLVDVVLEGFDEPPEVSVVRRPSDAGLGLATRTGPPYRLIAPAITTIRIRGRCRVVSMAASSIFPDVSLESFVVLSAPVGPVPGRYVGTDPDETAARARVSTGAPLAFGPHEPGPSPGSAAEAEAAELQRVDVLAGALRDGLHALVSAPIGGHAAMAPLPAVQGHPAATRAEFQDRMVAMVAGGDPGLARWLGLADQLPDLGVETMLVTAMAVWALSPDHPFARHAGAIGERDMVRNFFDNAGLGGVTALADELGQAGPTPMWLYSQAWVDLGVPPDRPPPPSLAAGPRPVWIRGATEDDDVALVSLETHGVAVLGQLGLVRTNPDPAPLHGFVDGTNRLRSQLAVEGTAVNDRVTSPFGGRTYRGWQSDAFGRWSDDFDELMAPPVERVPLPAPDPILWLGAGEPVGEDPWTPTIGARIGIPPRAGGQREVVRAVVATAAGTESRAAPGQEAVVVEVAAPALLPGATGSAVVTATFLAANDAEESSRERTIAIVDPRPPAPPPLPPVLRFAARPDGSGVSTAAIPLPLAPGVVGYFVETARESDLIVASGVHPPDGLSRDARAQFWLQQPRRLVAAAFYRLTASAVDIAGGPHHHDLPGDLAELVAFRLVPVGANHASPDPRVCGFALYAVPRDVAPPRPVLVVDRSVEPAVLEVRSAPGAVPAVDVRIRALPDPDADPRTGLVVATGTLAGGVARLGLPATEPGVRRTYVAEVRGEPEAGVSPSLGRWSAPSNPVRV